MRIAFLGTGRMGTELALHLLTDHQLTVWNRTASRTERLAGAGASVAATAAEAVEGADLVITSLFGPDAVRETVLEPGLIPVGTPWADTTTVSPADADEFAAAVPTYVGVPVVGTLGPARAGSLGVFVGSPDAALRERVLDVVAPWADPERLRGVESARKAATGKLLANLALAVSAQGLREALALGDAAGASAEETLDLLGTTGLAFIAGMKGAFVRGERTTEGGDFTASAIAKDARLMIDTVDAADGTWPGADLPALRSALASLDAEIGAGHGEDDFSTILLPGAEPTGE
ncbi:NAD(P)-dependent oxidoreductase [Brachybacterium alimentarium]|uniref:Hydroxyacid dehydrogenase n=1 Tax=Brachybacterium alimentarium TaxID=47845 RepID=A0A2A3YL03_9MICO|nr:NAD(P)-binding domain-containing protein [Brachybacterium alimentarium]PCC39961.1 hydroxyacid dehydrogenase [Brachybacterium alimentarium]RCS67292.1 NAD(P)-dependent oxidoreductase [Brachybacterium alimentarium]RCS77198.1 NAD(P)-dependent oxidoreductase [Brachybacterium alimentarium]